VDLPHFVSLLCVDYVEKKRKVIARLAGRACVCVGAAGWLSSQLRVAGCGQLTAGGKMFSLALQIQSAMILAAVPHWPRMGIHDGDNKIVWTSGCCDGDLVVIDFRDEMGDGNQVRIRFIST
jgi:hypothetical protein